MPCSATCIRTSRSPAPHISPRVFKSGVPVCVPCAFGGFSNDFRLGLVCVAFRKGKRRRKYCNAHVWTLAGGSEHYDSEHHEQHARVHRANVGCTDIGGVCVRVCVCACDGVCRVDYGCNMRASICHARVSIGLVRGTRAIGSSNFAALLGSGRLSCQLEPPQLCLVDFVRSIPVESGLHELNIACLHGVGVAR